MKFIFIILMLICWCQPVLSHENIASKTQSFSKSDITSIIDNVSYELEHTYLFPEKTTAFSKHLQEQQLAGTHTTYNREEFQRHLKAALIKSTFDTGFDIIETRPFSLTDGDKSQVSQGSITVEVLENNIGYLKVTGDLTFLGAKKIVTNAFKSLENVDALILDLRLADKMSMNLAHQIVSYFLTPKTPIGKVKYNNYEEALVSIDVQASNRFTQLPLFILNSAFVAGEWEYISFILQQLNKAVILGDETMGLGYFTKSVKISETLSLVVPYAVINDQTSKDNWVNFGVTPDYFTQGDSTMSQAMKLSLIELKQ